MIRGYTGPDPMITHGSILAVFFMASTQERMEGRDWYPRALRFATQLSKCYGVPVEAAAGVLAALSPNNRWERNCHDAEHLISTYINGGDLEAVKVATYGKNKDKALMILVDKKHPLDVLGGNKVRAFYRCIMQDDAVCVDGHAYSIWSGQRYATSSTPSISDKLYKVISDDYREAATQVSEILGEHYSASEVQAVTWIAWRRLVKSGAIADV